MNKRVKRAALHCLLWAALDRYLGDGNVDQYWDLIRYPGEDGMWP